MLDVYETFAREHLAIPVLTGRKSASERFPGAVDTFCIEAMVQDRKAVQAGTSHFLGQNFAQAAGIQYLSREGKKEFAWTTSWGVSTRLIGTLIMTHADDDGLVLPPRVAPTQVVIFADHPQGRTPRPDHGSLRRPGEADRGAAFSQRGCAGRGRPARLHRWKQDVGMDQEGRADSRGNRAPRSRCRNSVRRTTRQGSEGKAVAPEGRVRRAGAGIVAGDSGRHLRARPRLSSASTRGSSIRARSSMPFSRRKILINRKSTAGLRWPIGTARPRWRRSSRKS